MSSFYRAQLESWLAELDVKAGTVLDIGGSQGPVKGRTKSWDVDVTRILDIPEFDLDHDYLFGELVKLNLTDGADVIFCLEVFEYLIDPVTAMMNIKRLLKPDGKAYITFAFCYPHHNELELDSLRYTESGIHRLAQRVGLSAKVVKYRVDKSGLLTQFYAADGMRAAKQYDHHDATGFIAEISYAT